MSTKHTPTPWAVATDDHERSLIATVGYVEARAFGLRFANHQDVNYESHSSSENDAAFICLAVNNHDALLALARQYASECAECRGKGVVGISNYDGHGSDADDQPCEGCKDIRAVIAKAVMP